MSAWYMFAALGFYPLNPVSGEYLFCAPLFDKAAIQLPEGKSFTIITHKTAPSAQYIQQVKLNGQLLVTNYITYKQIMQGGKLEVFLQEQPNKQWGVRVQAQASGISVHK
jgi:putative alpha-1,2-mannosidase